MNNNTVHGRKNSSPRTYFGEAEAADLLNWLNAKNSSDKKQLAKAKVESVMTLLQSLHENVRTFAGQKPSTAFLRDQKELNVALLEYEFVNRVDYDPSLGLTWNLSSSADLSMDWVRGEAEAIAQIRDLDKMGVLAQVRKCDCGEYFFVRFPKREPPERFCSEKCRVEFWEKSAVRKKQKQKNAKENYKRQKEKESSYLHKRKSTK
jgi:hypothetical protein